jgi:hypothetical protein
MTPATTSVFVFVVRPLGLHSPFCPVLLLGQENPTDFNLPMVGEALELFFAKY